MPSFHRPRTPAARAPAPSEQLRDKDLEHLQPRRLKRRQLRAAAAPRVHGARQRRRALRQHVPHRGGVHRRDGGARGPPLGARRLATLAHVHLTHRRRRGLLAAHGHHARLPHHLVDGVAVLHPRLHVRRHEPHREGVHLRQPHARRVVRRQHPRLHGRRISHVAAEAQHRLRIRCGLRPEPALVAPRREPQVVAGPETGVTARACAVVHERHPLCCHQRRRRRAAARRQQARRRHVGAGHGHEPDARCVLQLLRHTTRRGLQLLEAPVAGAVQYDEDGSAVVEDRGVEIRGAAHRRQRRLDDVRLRPRALAVRKTPTPPADRAPAVAGGQAARAVLVVREAGCGVRTHGRSDDNRNRGRGRRPRHG
mmetsp:Transcript_26704/g.92766  ORF Transcript_26704/g.92766 Transcript_26704/m.92766 type:complete len:367 (+) Transcript_26704:872-1972(+)